MQRRAWATMAVAALLTVVFLAEVAAGAAGNPRALLRLGALPNDAVLNGQSWRLLTYGFLHLDLLHLAATLALLVAAGPPVERRLGPLRWGAILAASTVGGGAFALLVRLLDPRGGATMGAGAGAFGLLAAAAVVTWPRRSERRPRRWLALAAAVAAASCFLPAASAVGNLAGLVVGALLAILFLDMTRKHALPGGRRRRLRAAAGV